MGCTGFKKKHAFEAASFWDDKHGVCSGSSWGVTGWSTPVFLWFITQMVPAWTFWNHAQTRIKELCVLGTCTAEQYRHVCIFGYRANKKKRYSISWNLQAVGKKKLPILFLTWKGMNERLFGDKYWARLLGTHDGFTVQLLLLFKREKAEWVLKIWMSISSKRRQIKMGGLMFRVNERHERVGYQANIG